MFLSQEFFVFVCLNLKFTDNTHIYLKEMRDNVIDEYAHNHHDLLHRDTQKRFKHNETLGQQKVEIKEGTRFELVPRVKSSCGGASGGGGDGGGECALKNDK